MRNFAILLRREIQRLFLLPQTYGIAAGFFIVSGIFFINIVISSQSPDMASYYSNLTGVIIFLCPIIAMRSFAEERMSGSLSVSLSWPISRFSLVMAKFLANTLFAWLLVSIAWLYVRLLTQISGIDIARSGGGWIGMLFLTAAFGALALMVSAWASSTTSAAFIGCVLLLFLVALQYAPGWIYWLNRYGPNKHLQQMYQGAVFLNDAVYFILMTVIGLGLATYLINRSRPGLGRNGRYWSAAVGVVAILALAIVPPLVDKVNGEIDLESGQQNTISQTTRDVLKVVHGRHILVTAYVSTFTNQEVTAETTVQKYKAAGANISLDVVDPDIQPGRAEEAGVLNTNEYTVQIGKGEPQVLPDLLEPTLTTALNQLSRPNPPTVCYTFGHGERLVSDTSGSGLAGLVTTLKAEGFLSKTVAIGAPGGSDLSSCQELAIIGPQNGFLPGELQAITDYVAHNGHLVVAADGNTLPIQQLNPIVANYGVEFGDQIVHDNESVADDTASVVSSNYPSANQAVQDLSSNSTPVIMSYTLFVKSTQAAQQFGGTGGYVSNLVQTSSHSWTQDAGGQHLQNGPFQLANVADLSVIKDATGGPSQETTRIALLGSVSPATNRFASEMGNQQMMTSLVQWLGLSNDLVSAGRAPGDAYKLLLTSSQKTDLTIKGIVLPSLAALIFFPAAFLRLKRG